VAREKVDRSRGAWIDPRKADTTFGDVAAAWLESDPGKTESSLSRDTGIIRNHLQTLDRQPVGSITPGDVQALVTKWSKRQAPRTVRRHYDVLRAICTYAVVSDFIARSPCRNVKLPKPVTTRQKALTKPELVELADALGDQYGPMVYAGAVLGLRWGECAGLRVADLDFLARTLTVNTQRTRGIGGRMIEGMPKSDAGRRTLSVPLALMELLAAHLYRRGVTAADPDAYVFVGTRGRPLQYTAFRQRVWKTACRKIGLPDLGFHDLRRTNATLMVRKGVDVKTAQARLGHSDPRLTLGIYAQATTEGDRTAADLLGELLEADDVEADSATPKDAARQGRGTIS
jgi:integrase